MHPNVVWSLLLKKFGPKIERNFRFADSEDDSSDTDLNDADIESMLNDRLPEELKNKKVEAQYDEKFKTVLEGEDVL